MRSSFRPIVLSALALAGACSSRPASAPAPVSPDVARNGDGPAPEVTRVGGACTYTKFVGRCQLTELGEHPVMTFIGTVDGKPVELPGNAARALTDFARVGIGSSAACTLEFETHGTCTPCVISLGECGQAAWDAFRAHK